MKKVGLLLIVFIIVISSCKKQSQSPSSLILGKWGIDSIHNHYTTGGVEYSNTYTYDGYSEYYDFKTSSLVDIKWNGPSGFMVYTFAYNIPDNNHIIIDTEEKELRTLTSNLLTLYSKTYTGTDYSEGYIYCHKIQ